MAVYCNAHVITCNKRDEILPEGYVAVEKDKISAVGTMSVLSSAAKRPHGERIDLKGKTVIPGLVNAHIHFTRRRFMGSLILHPDIATESFFAVRTCLTSLGEGVTAAADLGHNDNVHMQLRDAINSGLVLGPRIKVAGNALVMSWGHAHFVCQQVHSLDEAVAEVRRQISLGVDFVKLIASNEDLKQAKATAISVPWFDMNVLKACVATAHESGIPVAVHANGAQAIDRVLQANVDRIEHGIGLNREQAREMKRQNIFYIPTMTGYHENVDPKWGRTTAWREGYCRLWSYHPKSVATALEEGVTIGTGTDVMGTIAEEMRLLTDIGMKNYDSLKAATVNGARIMEMENEIGSLEPGKFADFLVLNGNLLDNIEAVGEIAFVVKGGNVYTPEELEKFLPRCSLFPQGW